MSESFANKFVNQPVVIAVVGSTASGKSALGISLAQKFDGEIINCDSVQVYREIEIATAKVSIEEQQGIPHHLLDFVPPARNYTAGDWGRDALGVIKEIIARGRLPIIVGGTGFYLRSLRQPLFESVPTDEHLRVRLAALRERRGAEYLHRMLQRVDAESAGKLFARDWVRVTRALEFWFQNKERLSDAHRRTRNANANDEATIRELNLPLHTFALNPPRAELYRRINGRTQQHFAAGLIDEVRQLLARGVAANSTALGAHGYRRAVEFLNGERTLESAIVQTQIDVRRYAKRQMTWLRREPAVEWFDGFGDDSAVQNQVAACLAKILSEAF